MSDWTYTRITTNPTEVTSQYVGIHSTIPTETAEGLPIMVGDYFVASDDFEEEGFEFRKGVPYICINTSGDIPEFDEMSLNTENSEKVLNCLSGVITNGLAVPSTSALYGWFENLVAQNAVIQNLFSQAITILNGGSIKSQNYSKGVSGFKIDSDGNSEFVNTDISGKVKASTFDFSNVNMRWACLEYQSGTSYVDLTSNFGVTQGDLVTINWSKIEDDPTPGTTVSIILDDSVRDIRHSRVIVNSSGVTISYIRGVGGVDYGLSITTNARISLAVQAYHKTT